MSLTRMFLLISALAGLFYSCTKEDLPDSGDKLLHRIVSDNDSLISATFSYDAQNRLVKVVDSIRYGHQWETSIVYNGAGNPVKLTTLYRSPSNIIDFAVIDSLVYENGRVIKKYQDWPYSSHAGHFFLMHHYLYDARGRLITDVGGQTPDLTDAGWHQNFSYDADDNLVKMDEKYYTLGTISTTLTYNSNPNPYHNTGLILYFVKGDNLLLGKHNKTRVIRQEPNVEPLTIDYTYLHDRDGLLKKMVINRSQRGTSDSTSTFDFYYQ
jgi:hypothetical protein